MNINKYIIYGLCVFLISGLIFCIIFFPVWFLVIKKSKTPKIIPSIISYTPRTSNLSIPINTTAATQFLMPIKTTAANIIMPIKTTAANIKTTTANIIRPIKTTAANIIMPIKTTAANIKTTAANIIMPIKTTAANIITTQSLPTSTSLSLLSNIKIISNATNIYILTQNNILYKMNSDFNNSASFSKIDLYNKNTKWNNVFIFMNIAIGLKFDNTIWLINNIEITPINNDKWLNIFIDYDNINYLYIIYGIKTDNTLWKWSYGSNLQQVRDPIMTNISNLSWNTIYQDATNNKTMGILTTGELYAWGNNINGSLGINISSDSDNYESNIITPTLVSDDKWDKISIVNNIILGIKSDLSLWIWTYNNTHYYSPVKVNEIQFKDVQINNYLNTLDTNKIYILAIDINNNLWGMGYNNKGILGINNQNIINNLTLINNSNWKKVISYNGIYYGIKNDDTLWSWGRYNYFNKFALFDQPEDAIIIREETPITNLKWRDIIINPILNKDLNTFYCLGITTDNKLYGWGLNLGNILNLNQLDFNNNTINQIGQIYNAVKEPIQINLPDNL